jgi:hypothetical protein
VLLLAAQPAAFFLVAGYSEALFLLAVLGFLFWAERTHPAALPLAALHGFVMTGTRLVGVPLVFYPLVRACLRGDWRRPRQLFAPLLIGATASLGALAFFAYCHFSFGRWDLYMQTQAIGWHVKPNALALFSSRLFEIGTPDWSRGVDPDFVSRVATLLTLLAFVGLIAAEVILALRGDRTWRQRAPLYFAAFFLFWVPLTGFWFDHFRAMTRHVLAPTVLLVLAGMHLLARHGVVGVTGRWRIGWLVVLATSAALQLALACRFTHGCWVA